MIFCPGCGAQMHEAAGACPACGKPNGFQKRENSVSTGWFVFRGRISRKIYWLHYILPMLVVSTVGGVLDRLIQAEGIVSTLVALLLIVPGLTGPIKRLHDRNHTGWLYLVALIPVVGWIWFFIEAGCLRGTPGFNRFGDDPVEEVNHSRFPMSQRA